MAETLMKPKGLGISSPHCGSYLALIGERQDTASVRRMILQGAGSFLALPCGSGEIIGRQQLVSELLEFMGRAELAPVQQVHSLADLEQYVDFAAVEKLVLDRFYTADDLLLSPESSKEFIEAGSKALESLAYQLQNDEELKAKLPQLPTSFTEGVNTYGLEVLMRVLTTRDVLCLKVWADTLSKFRMKDAGLCKRAEAAFQTVFPSYTPECEKLSLGQDVFPDVSTQLALRWTASSFPLPPALVVCSGCRLLARCPKGRQLDSLFIQQLTVDGIGGGGIEFLAFNTQCSSFSGATQTSPIFGFRPELREFNK